MSYEKYDCSIRLERKVQLCGWPSSIRFQSPYNITVMSDVRLLQDSLKSGECYWVEMNSREHDDLKRELKGKDPKSKKQGKGKRMRSGNDENEDPSAQPPARKKARKGQKEAVTQPDSGRTPRSRSIISSDEND